MNRKRALVLNLVPVMLAAVAAPARADVKLPAVIGDHMVIQQGMPVPIWGWADSGEEVTVSAAGQKKTATAAEGKWVVRLDALKAGGEPIEIKITGKNEITLKDVLVGEVWVCSGQSNMEWPVRLANNPDGEIKAANYPQIRLFTVPKKVSGEPLNDTAGSWVACTPETIPNFSAVGYFFGRELHKELKVPVGLIHSSWGGTPAESWTTQDMLASDPDFAPILTRWKENETNYPKALAQWEEESAKAKADGKPTPRKPGNPDENPWKPAGLYNAMLQPVVPFAIRGGIWYQGESNAGRAYQYRKLLPAMVKSWRQAWGQDLSFLIVSLANFTAVKDEPGESDWAELREAQAMTAAMPNNGQAMAIDVGDAADIHPRDKQSVGRRLMLAALKVSYGRDDVVASGPVYDSIKIEGGTVRVKFKNASGLMSRGFLPIGFAIAGEDRKWVWAHAEIDGDSVIVWNPKVSAPKAVRYAWANNPVCNLYNGAGLPAEPFRTDDWPGVTVNNK